MSSWWDNLKRPTKRTPTVSEDIDALSKKGAAILEEAARREAARAVESTQSRTPAAQQFERPAWLDTIDAHGLEGAKKLRAPPANNHARPSESG